jgi:hypothetical protein
MTKNSIQRDHAEARFAATQSRARLERAEVVQAGDEKTARLKALRLAKEAAEAVAASKKGPVRKARG